MTTRFGLHRYSRLRVSSAFAVVPLSTILAFYLPVLAGNLVCIVRLAVLPFSDRWYTAFGWLLLALAFLILVTVARRIVWRRSCFRFVFKRESKCEISVHLDVTPAGKAIAPRQRVSAAISQLHLLLVETRGHLPASVDVIRIESPWFGSDGAKRRFLLTRLESMAKDVFPCCEIAPVDRFMGRFETLLVRRCGDMASRWRALRTHGHTDEQLRLGGFTIHLKPGQI